MKRFATGLAVLACLAVPGQAQPASAPDIGAVLAPVAVHALRDYRQADSGPVCVHPDVSASAFEDIRVQRRTLFAERARWTAQPRLRQIYERIGRPHYEWVAPRQPGDRGPRPLDAEAGRLLNESAGAFIRAETPAPVPGSAGRAWLGGLPACADDRQLPVLRVGGPAISGDVAFVETGYTCGGLCGDGRLYALQRGPDGWQVVATTPTWIS